MERYDLPHETCGTRRISTVLCRARSPRVRWAWGRTSANAPTPKTIATGRAFGRHSVRASTSSTQRSTIAVSARSVRWEALSTRRSVPARSIGGYGCAAWLGLRVPPDNRQHLSLSDLVALARDIGGPGNHFRVVQLPFGLGMPEAARNPTQRLGGKLVPLFEAAEALGLGVVVSAPLMQGRLVADLPDEVRELFPTCTTDAQRSLRFAASLPAVSTVLTGMRRTEHVRENVAAWRQVMA